MLEKEGKSDFDTADSAEQIKIDAAKSREAQKKIIDLWRGNVSSNYADYTGLYYDGKPLHIQAVGIDPETGGLV